MIVSVSHLTKQFGTLTAVDSVDWAVPEGEIRAIIGPNGAGKTTFFNMIAGITLPTDGTITFDGTDITNYPAHRRAQLGIVKTFQEMSVFEDTSVFENVRISAQADTSIFDVVSKASDLTAVNDRAWDVLGLLDLATDHGETVGDLSYGDQRKVEIGIALANDPSVLLLDEPTSGISSDSVGEITTILRELSRDSDLTIVITEHDLEVILDLADRITVFHQGAILSEGSPDEIMADSEVQRVYVGE